MLAESAIPPHLRRFVVRQNYAEYTEEDQAIWRFVVLQTHEHLLRTAHAAYGSGFDGAGISVDRIPRIDEMSDRLSRFGWSAVSVDGFIPPRVFQAFQARSILPVATDIRSSRHLTYTPAPDVIHEAAGHAPFLIDPSYASYVRRISSAAENAFESPADRELYVAISTLSEVKEDPSSTPSQLARALQVIEQATRRTGPPSDAVKLARLYWWTAEYGLVGTVDDFRLYGAGLLSSIGEGHFCRQTGVRKLPLSAACVDVDYDITQAQPQLFVARDFEQLEEVLDEVTATLAYQIGGAPALDAALASEEVATLDLDSGAQIVGVVTAVHRHDGEPALVELAGPCAVAENGVVLDAMPRTTRYAVPLGNLDDGTPLSELGTDALARYTEGDTLNLRLKSGISIRGHVRAQASAEGRLTVVLLERCRVTRGDSTLFEHDAPFPLALGTRVRTARAAAPHGFYPATDSPTATVPRPRTFDAAARELIQLYDRATEAWRRVGGSRAGEEFERILRRLDEAFPNEWLLRWNLLETLVKLGERSDLTRRLEADLERLEIRFDRLEPIATGLSYVRSLVTGSASSSRQNAD